MSWDDVEDILFDGSYESIRTIVCPDCGHPISYRYSANTKSMQITCINCGYISRSTGVMEPNCAKLFGAENTLPQ